MNIIIMRLKLLLVFLLLSLLGCRTFYENMIRLEYWIESSKPAKNSEFIKKYAASQAAQDLKNSQEGKK